jgi:hypothetical protein
MEELGPRMDTNEHESESKKRQLPEFRVTLTRLKPGEQAFPNARTVGDPRYDDGGQRTKLGGSPTYEQGEQPPPTCPSCGKLMTFVAQIDSVEHDAPHNPHRVHCLSTAQQWMFGDVGMIHVFFCFECCQPMATFECG